MKPTLSEKHCLQACQKDFSCEADFRARVRANVIENSERTRTRSTNTDLSEAIERNPFDLAQGRLDERFSTA